MCAGADLNVFVALRLASGGEPLSLKGSKSLSSPTALGMGIPYWSQVEGLQASGSWAFRCPLPPWSARRS
eukprot:11228243-Lingulodinium_polyedra.AAC.1